MDRSRALVTFVAVISLSLGAIWPNEALAATAPAVQSLGAVQAGLFVPGELDIDASGNLYVADARARKIFKYNAPGAALQTFDAVAVTGNGLAVTPDGARIYAAVDGGVAMIDGATGVVSGYLGGDSALIDAGDVGLDAAGNVYVVDQGGVQVQVFSADGTPLSVISGAGTGDGLFTRITALAVNAASGEVYVAGEGLGVTNRSVVQIFGLDGQFRSKLTLTADFGGALSLCSGIAFDAAGREYYLNILTGDVRVRDRATGYLTNLALGGKGAGLVMMPAALAFDAQTSRLFVSSDNAKVESFGIDGGTTPAQNEAPAMPQLLAPVAGGEVAVLPAELHFKNAVDANGDVLTYQVQFSGADDLLEVAEAAGGETVVAVPGALVENAAYSWSVQASDSSEVSGFTAAQTFYVNAVQEAPTAPVLGSGASGEALVGSDLLTWQASTDADPGDSVYYRVDVAATAADFDQSTLVAEIAATQIGLNEFADYMNLVDGNRYVWRVTAIDNHGDSTVSELGSFVYDTAVLKITADLPDAKVYLAGNDAYPGRLVGTTPLEFRDLAAGQYTVVVEHAGCETYMAQVEVSGQNNAVVAAELQLAKEPVLSRGLDLRTGRTRLQVHGAAAPFAVDFDNDGLDDLLVGDESGTITYYRALAQRGVRFVYDAGVSLGLTLASGATVPVVVDWNDDNRKDILVGQNDGALMLFLQSDVGLDSTPQFAAGVPLMDKNGDVLNAGIGASPVIIDLDGDGDKDLVVGNADGDLLLFDNQAEAGATVPVLTTATLIGHFPGAITPQAADWNADGVRELLVGLDGSLVLLQKGAEGLYIEDATLLKASKRLAGEHFYIIDIDGGSGKDVFVGTDSGKVQLVRSVGKTNLPSVNGALLDKLAQIEALGGDTAKLAAISAAIEANSLRSAQRLLRRFAARQTGELAMATDELQALLAR